MTALQILECLCYMGEDSEKFSIVDIFGESLKEREEFCERFFGGKPEEPIESGKYLYYWTDENLTVLENGRESFRPDNWIFTEYYNSYGIRESINLYLIED